MPKVWLMTDPRLGEGLLAAVRKLPMRSGVVFRHYDLPIGERRIVYQQVRKICRQRGHMLLLAGDVNWPADGVHGRRPRFRNTVLSCPVHNIREIAEAKKHRADLMFLSPLFPTRSHPGVRTLGLAGFAALARLAYPAKVIALGGMTQNRARALDNRVIHGWAAIDAFT